MLGQYYYDGTQLLLIDPKPEYLVGNGLQIAHSLWHNRWYHTLIGNYLILAHTYLIHMLIHVCSPDLVG